jgi:bacterioferritin
MIHLNILGEILIKLGVSPAYYNTRTADFYSASSVSYTRTPKRMILDDIAGEIKAVKSYSDVILAVGDSELSAILTRIKIDEELHIVALKNALEKL